MAKLTRKTQKLFGENSQADEMTSFGSPTLNNPVFTRDLDLIQSAEYMNGWFPTILDGAIRPYAEDMNGMFYLFSYQLKYILEQGIAEWDSGTTYYKNSLAKYGTETYISLQDNNTNHNPLSSTGYWQWYVGLTNPAELPVGCIQDYAGANLTNYKWTFCDGRALSRSAYPELFAVIGTTYGAGDGSTTFNVPDLRQRFSLGLASNGTYSVLGKKGGSIDHAHVVKGHKHGVGNLAITGASGSHTHALVDNGHTHETNPHKHDLQFSDVKCKADYTSQGLNVTDVTHDGHYSGNSPTVTERTTVTVNGSTSHISISASSHTHDSSSFTGTVGNVSGLVGDQDQASGSNNPPYIILRKIIKVK